MPAPSRRAVLSGWASVRPLSQKLWTRQDRGLRYQRQCVLLGMDRYGMQPGRRCNANAACKLTCAMTRNSAGVRRKPLPSAGGSCYEGCGLFSEDGRT